MRSFFCRSADIRGDTIHITDKTQLHHIRDVLRYRQGDDISCFDETGSGYAGKIIGMDKDGIIINIFGRIGRPESKRPFITIACAIPKQTKMEDIVDKITQLGADRLIPLITERVIVKLDQHKKDLKLSRWQKIAIQASEQSGRKTLPVISPVMTFTEALSETNGCRLKLIPTLEGRRKHIREIMRSETPGSVAAFIGPEGDFTPREVAAAQQHGFTPVSLGETVLRVDTATIALTTLLVSGLDIGQNSEK